MDAEINAVLSQLNHEQILVKLQNAGIAYASVNDLAALSGHPQLRRTTVEFPGGQVDLVAPPAREPGVVTQLGAVPSPGEQSESIRNEFA